MKWFFESCILAIGIAFVGWVIIIAGVRFEFKYKGEEYGFSVGGPDSSTKHDMFIKRYYWSTQGNAATNTILFTGKELQNISPRVFEDFMRWHSGNLMNCRVEYEGRYPEPWVLFNLTPTKYPEIPNYTALPYTTVTGTYTVVKGENPIDIAFKNI